MNVIKNRTEKVAGLTHGSHMGGTVKKQMNELNCSHLLAEEVT
jgi:hypothetical protein